MLHSQPIDWEVVESYSVDPVRVYVEDDGATIVRLAPHEIVGDYTFDMTPPARSTQSPHATRKAVDIPSKGLKSYCPRRRRASHSNSAPHSRSHQSRPTLPERHSDPPASRSLDHESHIRRTASPEQISDPNTPITTPEGGSPKSKRMSLSLSFLKPHRRSSSSSSAESSSSGASDAGTSDGESDPVPRPSRAAKHPSSSARVPTRAPVEVPAYKKSDLKRALIFARHELMKQVTQSGKNALVVEGWTVTILRQSSMYRIHIEYIGRPAIVTYPEDTTPSSVPPFLEVVDR